jgi:hypothetical protein
MMRWLRLAAPCALLAAVLACAACNKAKDSGPLMAGGMGGPGSPRPSSPIAKVMDRLTKGQQSLTTVIGMELQQDPPPWDTLVPQSKEFAQLASSLGKYDPPKGSKESWAKLTGAYAESAASLEKAAEAKDKDAAVAAHQALAGSCRACHMEHRVMGPPGMPGGFPGKGPPGGQPQ